MADPLRSEKALHEVQVSLQELEEVLMHIVGGLDIHRQQITFDWVDRDSGEARRGRISPADRVGLRKWLGQFEGEVELVCEGCTGWRFVAEECRAAGVTVQVADPAEVAGRRSRKRRAKTDPIDARQLRELAERGEVPKSWIPPVFVLEVRERVRLYLDLLATKQAWEQRIHATLFHHGVPKVDGRLLACGRADRGRDDPDLSDAGREAVDTALRVIAEVDVELDRVRAELVAFGRRHPGPRELSREYGLGALLATVVWEELGDTRRFTSSRHAVRHTGLDVSVYDSDGKQKGRPTLTRQGPPALRWALYEGAVHAQRKTSPDHAYYTRLAGRVGAGRARLAVARKLARRCHHRLRALGDQAWVDTAGQPVG
jgi:transposase